MDISSLQGFLSSSKAKVGKALTNDTDIHQVILGNEAADLDSVVSSIVFAYYTAHSLAKEEKENKALGDDKASYVFPVINCSREELPLRTEVVYFLKENGVRVETLICRDEIDLVSLLTAGKLKLTLVDHNVLAPSDAPLLPSVVRVIDHHKREKVFDRRDVIEPVGSCSTLVAEMVLGLFDTDPVVCMLLYGTILLDTVNLSVAAQRTTPRDLKAVSDLEECLAKKCGLSKSQRDDVYNPIVKARADISLLSAEQLLRKDCKILKTPEISVAIPAVPLLSQKYLELPGALDALRTCLRNNRCSAVVLMGWEVSDASNIHRDLTIFSDGIHKAKQVCTPLENCESLHLEQIRSSGTQSSQCCYWLYNQKNIALSRKFILPFLVTHFEVKAQNQLDVDALAGVEILIPNGEMSPNKQQHNANGQVPSISYTTAQHLGVGDPISQCGSNQSSAYNSCPYTPQNSCAEPEDGYGGEAYPILPSFNSREMIEKIESKRHKLRGYDRNEDQLNPGACSSYPFTPKNSFVESNIEQFEKQHQQGQMGQPVGGFGGILHSIDQDVLLRKLMEKRKGDSNPTSNTSSKSQSMTKLNTMGIGIEGQGQDLLGGGETPQFPLKEQQFYQDDM